MAAKRKGAAAGAAKVGGANAGGAKGSDVETVGPRTPAHAFGQLLRIALAPSAIADVVTGLALGYAGAFPNTVLPWLLVPASLGVYHGAMALNDWSDREGDARTRPERPIPSGAISAGLALFVAVVLLVGGLLWASAAGLRAGAWMAAVALGAVLYDVAGRGPLRGPLLLGFCRAGNLGVGASAAFLVEGAASFPLAALPVVLVYGAHVFSIGRLGRLEDDEDAGPLGERPTNALRALTVTTLLLPVAAWLLVHGAAAATAATRLPAELVGLGVGLFLAVRSALVIAGAARSGAADGWTRAGVGRATGLCLSRLPMTSASMAAAALLVGPLGPIAVAVALVGGWVGGRLRAVFPVT